MKEIINNESELSKKSKLELEVIAKQLKLSKYYKLSKNQLITTILKKATRSDLNRLGLRRKSFFECSFVKALIIIIPIALTIICFLMSPSKKDMKKIVSESLYEYNKSKLKPEEYILQIKKLQDLNSTLLKQILSGGYQVFGLQNGRIAKLDFFKNKDIINEFSSSIEFDLNKQKARIIINQNEVQLLFPNRRDRFYNNQIDNIIALKKVGEPVLIPSLQMDNYIYYFVMLNYDLNNPVFAIGLGKYR
jgi:hypothetical protein